MVDIYGTIIPPRSRVKSSEVFVCCGFDVVVVIVVVVVVGFSGIGGGNFPRIPLI